VEGKLTNSQSNASRSALHVIQPTRDSDKGYVAGGFIIVVEDPSHKPAADYPGLQMFRFEISSIAGLLLVVAAADLHYDVLSIRLLCVAGISTQPFPGAVSLSALPTNPRRRT
jgi:hypothetical protein